MNKSSQILVKCPTCQKELVWSEQSPYRPFCSKRCQLIDLGDWAAEQHRIADKSVFLDDVWSEDEEIDITGHK